MAKEVTANPAGEDMTYIYGLKALKIAVYYEEYENLTEYYGKRVYMQ